MVNKFERGMIPEEFYPGLKDGPQFYYDLVERHAQGMTQGSLEEELESEARMTDIAETTKAAITIFTMESVFVSSGYLLRLMQESGESQERLKGEVQRAVGVIEEFRDQARVLEGLEGWRTAPQLVVVDVGEAFIKLLKQEDDGWLLHFLEKDPEFTTHIGGIPDWLRQSPPA